MFSLNRNRARLGALPKLIISRNGCNVIIVLLLDAAGRRAIVLRKEKRCFLKLSLG